MASPNATPLTANCLILVSNPTKLYTSYSLKLSETSKKLAIFHFVYPVSATG